MPVDPARLSPADEIPGSRTLRLCYWGRLLSNRVTNLEIAQALAANRGEAVSEIHPKIREEKGDFVDGTVFLSWAPRGLEGVPAGLRLELRAPVQNCRSDLTELGRDALVGADGLVFVFDPQAEALEENLTALAELRRLLKETGRSLDTMPLVIQEDMQHLRSFPGAKLLSSESLEGKAPELKGRLRIPATVVTGAGVRETVAALVSELT